MSKTIEEILAPKPQARPRIYAYSIDDKAHAGLLKVGQTTRDVKQRVAERPPIASEGFNASDEDQFDIPAFLRLRGQGHNGVTE